MNRYPHKVTHVSFRETRIDKFQFEGGACDCFERVRKVPEIIFAALHINGRLVATYENTEDLELDLGRFGP